VLKAVPHDSINVYKKMASKHKGVSGASATNWKSIQRLWSARTFLVSIDYSGCEKNLW